MQGIKMRCGMQEYQFRHSSPMMSELKSTSGYSMLTAAGLNTWRALLSRGRALQTAERGWGMSSGP